MDFYGEFVRSHGILRHFKATVSRRLSSLETPMIYKASVRETHGQMGLRSSYYVRLYKT